MPLAAVNMLQLRCCERCAGVLHLGCGGESMLLRGGIRKKIVSSSLAWVRSPHVSLADISLA